MPSDFSASNASGARPKAGPSEIVEPARTVQIDDQVRACKPDAITLDEVILADLLRRDGRACLFFLLGGACARGQVHPQLEEGVVEGHVDPSPTSRCAAADPLQAGVHMRPSTVACKWKFG